MTWTYRGNPVNSHDDLLPECTDFVYMITYADGRKYIGKKAVRSMHRKPPLKGKKRVRYLPVNLKFVDYEGSHELEVAEIVSKEILYQCSSRKSSTYVEAALLFEYDAIFNPLFLNENIFGKFYPRDADGILDND